MCVCVSKYLAVKCVGLAASTVAAHIRTLGTYLGEHPFVCYAVLSGLSRDASLSRDAGLLMWSSVCLQQSHYGPSLPSPPALLTVQIHSKHSTIDFTYQSIPSPLLWEMSDDTDTGGG